MLVGLTGGIGSGKTIVANLFAELGANIINADEIGRQITANNDDVQNKIKAYFGEKVISNDEIDRGKLRKIVFSSEHDRKWLEGILHPLIKQEIVNLYNNSNAEYSIIETAILIESGFNELTEKIIVVDCMPETQISRVVARNKLTEQEVQQIIDIQLPRSKRLSFADKIIQNDSNKDDLVLQVKDIHNWLLTINFSI